MNMRVSLVPISHLPWVVSLSGIFPRLSPFISGRHCIKARVKTDHTRTQVSRALRQQTCNRRQLLLFTLEMNETDRRSNRLNSPQTSRQVVATALRSEKAVCTFQTSHGRWLHFICCFGLCPSWLLPPLFFCFASLHSFSKQLQFNTRKVLHKCCCISNIRWHLSSHLNPKQRMRNSICRGRYDSYFLWSKTREWALLKDNVQKCCGIQNKKKERENGLVEELLISLTNTKQ